MLVDIVAFAVPEENTISLVSVKVTGNCCVSELRILSIISSAKEMGGRSSLAALCLADPK
jgi:hypothetical protein